MNWSTATVYFVNEIFATQLITSQFPWDINASFVALFLNAFVVLIFWRWFSPLEWFWRATYRSQKCNFVFDSNKPVPESYLTFDFAHSKLILRGITSAPLLIDIVCTYELPASSWYQVRPRFECRLSTSNNVVHNKEKKGCIFGDDIVQVTVECAENDNGIQIYPTLSTLTDRPVQLIFIAFEFSLEHVMDENLSNIKMFMNGFQSWAPTGSVLCSSRMHYTLMGLPVVSRPVAGMMHNVDSEYWGRHDGLSSQHMTAFQDIAEEEAVLLGFTKQNTALGEFFFHRSSRHLRCSLDYDKTLFSTEIGERGGVSIKLEPLMIMRGAIESLMETWATECAPENYHRKLRDTASPVGWCSWYKYYDKVTQEDIYKNVDALSTVHDLRCHVVQLDDGYQSQIGDWLTVNSKFSEGLPGICRKIKKSGKDAGIWLAPFVAGRGSQLFKSRPEWFVCDSLTGSPLIAHLNPDWGRDFLCYSLDTTHPQVQAWLTHIFKTLVAYGFTYFKIDFLVAAIRRGKRHDRYSGRVEAYRKGLQVIREAIGPKCYLVGCGAPMGPSIGFFDAMRVSSDTSTAWDVMLLHKLFAPGDGPPALRNALHFSLTRSFLHRKWWLNDPDCSLFTEDGLTLAEMTLQMTVIGMSGGAVVISANMEELKEENINYLKKILPPSKLVCGQARDVLMERYPILYVCRGCNPAQQSSLYSFINWKNREIIIDGKNLLKREFSEMNSPENLADGLAKNNFPRMFYFDFWEERLLKKDLSLRLLPHGTRALLVTTCDGNPTLVGNSFHLTAMIDGRIEGHVDPNGSFVINAKDVSMKTGNIWIAMTNTTKEIVVDDYLVSSNANTSILGCEPCPSYSYCSVLQIWVEADERNSDGWFVEISTKKRNDKLIIKK